MADDANTPVSADAAKPVEEPTRPAGAPVESTGIEPKPVDTEDVAMDEDAAPDSKPSDSKEDASAKSTKTSDVNADSTETGGEAAAEPTMDATATNGTPATKKAATVANNGKRKSGAGVPEHKKKTPSKKKKAAPELRLNVQPGEKYMIAMRGYQPWPVIICDEEMLPESLISKRPVSAKRIDGTYREDFREGGKNAKDRRYPVMFLGTNEFAWQVNTELLPFDLETVKQEVEAGNSQKKSKSLWEAYEEAAKDHDLAYYKSVLADHEQAMQVEAQKQADKLAEKEKKKEKAAKRKSTIAESEDVEMVDADEEAAPAKKGKGSKKRKKEDDSDGENEKPAKTPKTKLKLNNKAPKDASATKPKKEMKPKKGKAKSDSEEVEAAPVEEKPMTEAERLEKREKSVLYLRHRLQKGFLTRDQAPKEEEMTNMSEYLKQLEDHNDLEAEIIKKTKVHKVLKAIIKLQSIPKEDEFQFKKRSNDLLTKWNSALAADTEAAGESAAAPTTGEPTTNGVHQEEEKKSDAPAPIPEKTEASAESSKAAEGDDDVSMADAKDETPTVKADASSSAEGATEAATETAAS